MDQFVGDSPSSADLRRYGIEFTGGADGDGNGDGSIFFNLFPTSSYDVTIVVMLVENPNFSSLSPTSSLRDSIVSSIRGRAVFHPKANIPRNQNKH